MPESASLHLQIWLFDKLSGNFAVLYALILRQSISFSPYLISYYQIPVFLRIDDLFRDQYFQKIHLALVPSIQTKSAVKNSRVF